MGYVGTYDRTIFYNPGNKYCIISVKTSDQSVPQQARSAYRHRDNMIRFIAVGYELPQTDKVSMILDGEWENGKHGVQLQVDKCEEIVPQTKEGVYGYLSSRLIKGVGEKTAALIVNRFGADALRVLENEPERLLEIRGITPDKLEDIKASYAESRCVRDLMILLTPFNVTPVTAMKIYEHFGSRSVDILQKNPYELCQVSGFGFKRVDAIVRKGDLPLNSPMRIHGAVFAALDTGRNEKGHLFLEEDALAKTGVKLLNEIITDGQVMPGNRILVSKRNMIIPQVEENLDRGDFSMEVLVPSLCPCCGYQTMIHTTQKRIDGELKLTKTLFCHNPNCASQNLRKFVHFVGKKAMDIEGLSEVTLEQFIARGWLQDFTDIYRLDNHREEIIRMDGFGERSWQRLWDAIQKSRNTSFERYLIAMDIPMIGNTASAALGRCFDQSLRTFEVAVDTGYDFTQLPDFGETLHNNIHEWFSVEENRILWEELKPMVNIEKKETTMSVVQDNPFVGKTLVVTGKVEPYTRDGINAKIYSLGAKAGSSVSKNTDYLICGENAGSKLAKAQALGVAVLSPAEFFRMIGE